MRIRKICFLLFMIICLSAVQSFTQESRVVLTPSQELLDAREDIDYSDDVMEEKEKEEEDEDPADLSGLDFPNILGVILILLLIGVVIAILYFVLGNENMLTPKSRKIKELDLEAVEQIEEDLENQDVASYLNQAITKKQFRIAIRLHYLLIIKELSEKSFIKWKKDKTNRNYLNETASFSFSEKFRSSTSIFEKVWYGERNVEEADFKMIYDQFNTLSSQINQTTT